MSTSVAARIASCTTTHMVGEVPPAVAFDHRLGDGAIDAARGTEQRRLAVGASRVPQPERSLRVGIDEQATMALALREGGKMSGQGALAGAAFAGSKRDHVHGARSPLRSGK